MAGAPGRQLLAIACHFLIVEVVDASIAAAVAAVAGERGLGRNRAGVVVFAHAAIIRTRGGGDHTAAALGQTLR